VDVELDFDGGGRRDPAGKSGLASVAASMTSKGIGAADGPALDENQLSEAWADLGASFGGGASSDRMSFTMRSLTYPDLLPRAAQLAARQLGDPTFPQAIWLRDRERFAASIREANTRPGTVAGRAFAAAVYGTHPYGAETTEASLAQIDVADMRDFYRRSVQPCRAKVSLVGDVTRAQADALVTTLLARLPQRPGAVCEPLAPVAEVAPLPRPTC
jgi:zinc protease